MYLDSISDPRVIANLEKLGNALILDPSLADNFSVARIKKVCGVGGKVAAGIAESLKDVGYAHTKPNNRTVLSLRCKALFRQSATIRH